MSNSKSLEETFGREFETQLLWLLLYDGNAANRLLGRIDPALLSTNVGQDLIEIATTYFQRYKTPPKVASVMTELLGRLAQVKDKSPARKRIEATIAFLRDEVKNIPPLTGGEQQFVLDKLQDFIQRRAIYNALIDGAMNFERGDYDQIVVEITDAMNAGAHIVAPSMGTNVYGSSIQEKLARYKSRRSSMVRVPTGISHLDPLMRGGLEAGTLGLFIGPTGRGKTMAMVHTGAGGLENGTNVVHFTMEISELETEVRYDARITQVPINDLMEKSTPAHVGKLTQKSKDLTAKGSNLYVKSYGPNEATVADLRVYLDTLRSEKNFIPGLVIIDYADLLRPLRKNREARRFELSEIIRDVRQLAVDYQCAVWTASQTGRNSFTTFSIKMSDVAECLEKVQVADVVVGLCQSESEQQRNLMRLLLLKNRLGGHEGSIIDCSYMSDKHTITSTDLQTTNAFRLGGSRRN